MNNYNPIQIKELDSFGEHLFCLDHKYISFFTEQHQEIENHLQTKVSNSERSSTDRISKVHKPEFPCIDDHFQMSFMKEHAFIAKKYISNYMKLFLTQNQEQSLFYNQKQNNLEFQLINKVVHTGEESTDIFSKANKQKIREDILDKQKIKEFFDIIETDYGKNITLVLKKIASYIWKEFQKLANKKLGERSIVEFCNKILTLKFIKKICYTLPHKGQGVELGSFKLFLNMFGNTLLFIINQYFLNPYYQLQEQLTVRQFQDYELFLYDSCVIDEQEQEQSEQEYNQFQGRKLRKLNQDF